mmetsp:Transcript_7155/g.6420  ORF Transcript_7155/g.6420 Transcript_7155/m.6420 type:complete len:341 (+) Transcript_7155:161-1183(+)|eukprot:CAMPEP_0196764112 /NCGR_PEP_ID=MMETSP1095-20130614/5366_1 /TAXON_ID=96789 ORGANISM="Chromulina nebulosa, Strain UTEXLB2642" /NCGR_SAMPLE_ID=MMETSP1095 /ASSEMBLY_ACC=CAM_ASM_000446 /LENGTH=340 /DNA_ID=CAMNT_0042118759 /DNA_START=140 /DNA_END=1162 /DNA_ORIENTATION=+
MATPNRAVKKTWIIEEDQALLRLIETYGLQQWSTVSSLMQTRTGKQCRERYYNHLQPNIKKGGWTEEEDKIIIEMQAAIGNQWSAMTKHLPGRTDNAIKNRWHAINKTLPNHSNSNSNNSESAQSATDSNSDTDKILLNSASKISNKKKTLPREGSRRQVTFENNIFNIAPVNNNQNNDPFAIFGPEIFLSSPFESDDDDELPAHTPLSYDMLDCLIEEYEEEVRKTNNKQGGSDLVIKTEDVELTDDEWSSIKFDLSLDEVELGPKTSHITVYQSNSIANAPPISPSYKKNLTVSIPDEDFGMDDNAMAEEDEMTGKKSTFMPRITPRSPADFLKKFRI